MLELAQKKVSNDGSIKYILKTQKGHYIETVFFRLDNKTTEHYSFSLCLSSQAGCALNCAFCATGKLGLLENLSSEQMLEQLHCVLNDLQETQIIQSQEYYHIALMGMGEPLHNFDMVCRFYKELKQNTQNAVKLSLSTVGLASKIMMLAEDKTVNYDLFLSLHTPFNEERNKLIPVNKKYPIACVLKACRTYAQKKQELVKISYLLMVGINDSQTHALKLARLLSPKYFAVQVLLYNPITEDRYSRPSYEAALEFQGLLRSQGLDCHIVVSKGLDISAGCGQLAGQFQQ